MQVEMIDCLTTIGSGVDDEAKTVVETLLLCNFVRCGEELTEKFGVARGGVCERCNVSLGDDQDMHRRLWIYIREREHVLILIEMRNRNRAGGNLAEEAVGGYSHVRMLEHFPCCWVFREVSAAAFSLGKTPIEVDPLSYPYRQKALNLRGYFLKYFGSISGIQGL
jgi:hypothetical protein